MITAKIAMQRPGPDFPKLMQLDDGEIALMKTPEYGTILVSPHKERIGYCSNSWNIERFTDYSGPLVLENEGDA